MNSKIDTLRQMVAAIGKTQIEYHKFFPSFADQLTQELGQFLAGASQGMDADRSDLPGALCLFGRS